MGLKACLTRQACFTGLAHRPTPSTNPTAVGPRAGARIELAESSQRLQRLNDLSTVLPSLHAQRLRQRVHVAHDPVGQRAVGLTDARAVVAHGAGGQAVGLQERQGGQACG